MRKHARALVSLAVGTLLLVGSAATGVTAANASTPVANVVAPAVTTGPTLQLSTTTGNRGTTFTVTGSGYTPDPRENVNIDFGGQFIGATSLSNPTFTFSGMVPTSAPVGPVDVHAVSDLFYESAAAQFTVLPPVVSLSTNSGTRGSAVKVSGVGYIAGENLTVSLGGIELGMGQIAGDGRFSLPASVPYPIPAGTQTLVVSTDQSGSQSFPFDVLAPPLEVSLGSASGLPGTDFRVNVAGYIPLETVQIFFGSNKQHVQQFTYDTDDRTWFWGFVPNGVAPGQYTVTVVGSRTTTPQTMQFTVLDASVHPQIGLSGGKGAAGTTFVIAGAGYTPGTRVTAAFGTSGPRLGSAVVDAYGTFKINATVPSVGAGAQTIVVTAPGASSLSTPFTVLASTKPVTTVKKAPAPRPVTVASSPTPHSTVGAAAAAAQNPATSTSARGLKVQTAVQGPAAAPATGRVATAGLLGILGLGLGTFVALRRKRRA